jgi:hypothetical protein
VSEQRTIRMVGREPAVRWRGNLYIPDINGTEHSVGDTVKVRPSLIDPAVLVVSSVHPLASDTERWLRWPRQDTP